MDRIPKYCLDKRKIECPDEHKDQVLSGLVEHYKDERIDLTDGVKIRYTDGWTLVRPSGTEPLFRVYSEGRDETCTKKYSDDCEGVLEDLIECACKKV